MTEAKVKDIVTKTFTFNIAECPDPNTELVQIISQAIHSYEHHPDTNNPCDIHSVIKYFASLYGVKI